MHILLKNLLKEDIEQPALKIQCYIDMDGVLVDMDGGFKKISGGLLPKEYEAKNGKNSFWKLINKHPNFWIELEPLPDAKILWSYINETFKDPLPLILSAGSGSKLAEQKRAWIKKHIDPSMDDSRIIIAKKGTEKPNYIVKNPTVHTEHILLDDTNENINAWNNAGTNMVALLHKNAAESIKNIKETISKCKK